MTSTPATKAITARNPDDLLAAVPVLIGFTPEESIAMLTLGPSACFHARIDLPLCRQDWDEVIETLLEPVLSYQVAQVAFVFYSGKPRQVLGLAAEVVNRFRERDVDVIDALIADGSRWYPALLGQGDTTDGIPYNSSTNPIALQAVVDGQVTFPSRAALADSLRGDQADVVTVEECLAVLGSLATSQVVAESEWVRETLRTSLGTECRLENDSCARLLRALSDTSVRDATWAEMTRDGARAHVSLWTDIVRRTPTPFLPAPAALLAFAAWLSGHGALSWCALDRCREAEADYPMADLLAGMLEGAVPPTAW